MNHFLLANRRYTRDTPVIESEAGRYGIHAMELLINEMLKQGAQRSNLKAKVFGGGDVLRYYKGGQDGEHTQIVAKKAYFTKRSFLFESLFLILA